MNFINEIVPQEDIDRFNLDALWNRFNPDSNPVPNDIFYHDWTVDREANCWFMPISIVKDEEESDANLPLYTNEYIFILHYKGKNIEVHLRKNREESSRDYRESPCYVVWELESISSESIETETVIEILKEALRVYGIKGILFQVKETIVKCKF